MSMEEWSEDKIWTNLGPRMKWGEGMPAEYGPIRLQFDARRIENLATGKSAHLTPLQSKVLWLLMRARGARVTRAEIEYFLYRDEPDTKDLPMSNGVNVAAASIRKAFDKIAKGKITVSNGNKETNRGTEAYALELTP